MEWYSAEAAAANGFGRNWQQEGEARLLSALPHMRVPSNWRLSAMGLLVPPVPTSEDRMAEIHTVRERMTEEQRADPIWDQENNFSWNAYFADRRERELHDYTRPPPAPKHNNSDSRKRWWGMPGRSLAYVLYYIEDGNEPRLQDPPRTSSVRRGWKPRRMSFSSSSSFGATRSTGIKDEPVDAPLRQPLARVKDEPPRRSSSRGIVIREAGTGGSSSHLLTSKKEPGTGGNSLGRVLKKAFKKKAVKL